MPRIHRGPLFPYDNEIERTLRSRHISHPLLVRRSPTSIASSSQAIEEEEFENPFFNLDLDLNSSPPQSPIMGEPLRETMGAHLRPSPESSGSPIDVGPINVNNFELRPNLITLIQQRAFNGTPSECPYQHLQRFKSAASTFKHNGVTPEKIKLMLFPWSLDNQAWRWLNSHPTGTFTTWDALEQAFMKKYYSAARTSMLRKEITDFKQYPFEPLHETWDRYKDILSQCPHHDIPPWMIITNFFNAVSEQHRNILHAASGAKFEGMSPDEVTKLISNTTSIASTRS